MRRTKPVDYLLQTTGGVEQNVGGMDVISHEITTDTRKTTE